MTAPSDLVLPEGSRIVHIGPHKTGTSSLQAAFFEARAEAAAQGVYYASEGKHAMTAVLAALDLPSPWSAERKPPPRWKWTRMLGMIKASSADRVLLSSEFFSDGSPAAVRRVIDELDPQRVQVVVTLRPLAKILPSQWQQWVQNQHVTAFDAWVRELLQTPEKNLVFWRRHRHDELIARWAEIVGPERMTVIALDDGDRDMVLRVFEGLTGLRQGTLEGIDDLSNRSMTVPEIEAIRAFNIAFRAEKLPLPLYSRVIRFGAAPYMRRRQPGQDEPRIELPAWAVEPIAERSREIVAGIAASGVRVIGDLEGLTKVPPPRAAGAEDAPIAISPEVAAAATMGVLLASGLARGTASILTDAAEGQASDNELRRAPRPVQEPAELLRISTMQLGIVIVRRARGAVVDRVAALFRRGRGARRR
ncbi:MAG: hypothetical protein ABI620_08995 [Chloroflexota bacterium]